MTAETGGRYFRATASESEIDAFYNDISGLEKKELESKAVPELRRPVSIPSGSGNLFLAAALYIANAASRGRHGSERKAATGR